MAINQQVLWTDTGTNGASNNGNNNNNNNNNGRQRRRARRARREGPTTSNTLDESDSDDSIHSNNSNNGIHNNTREKTKKMTFGSTMSSSHPKKMRFASILAMLSVLVILSGNALLGGNYSRSNNGVPSDGPGRKCIVIGMHSFAENHEIRAWHRQQLKDYQTEAESKSKKNNNNNNGGTAESTTPSFPPPKIILRFGVDNSQPVDDKNKSDLFVLTESPSLRVDRDTKKKEFTTRATFELMRSMAPFMKPDENLNNDDDDCVLRYYIRAQDNYFVDYHGLANLADTLPLYLTYFGSILTDFPTPSFEVRTEGGFAQTLFPKYAYGGLYGVSQDLYDELVMPFTEHTVNRNDPNFSSLHFPHQDQAVGLAFFRAYTTIVHYEYVTGIHHFCRLPALHELHGNDGACKRLGETVAFAVPNENGPDKTLSMLVATRQTLAHCTGATTTKTTKKTTAAVPKSSTVHGEQNVPTLLKIHHPRSDIDTKQLLLGSCPLLTDEGAAFRDYITKHKPAAEEQLSDDHSCAEQLYLLEHPNVAEEVAKGNFKDGKHHYVTEGWKEEQNNYFCPDRCKGMTGLECFESCDKEESYLESYPDIKMAVQAGVIKSGRDHYDSAGKDEGRAWGCMSKANDDSVGSGDECRSLWNKFVDNTNDVVKHWPVHGIENNLPSHRCKGLLLLDGLGGPLIDFTLRTHRRYMGPDWIFYMVGPPSLTKEWRPKYEGPNVKVVDIPERFGNLSDYPREVNLLYRSQWLWNETLQCEYIVNSHTDVFMFRSGLEDFLQYSYAGAPVEPEVYQIKEWRQMCVKGVGGRCGGGGGLSIRRRSYVLRAFQDCKFPFQDPPYSEDMWMAYCHMLAGDTMTLPHPTEGNRLSLGGKCNLDNPIGMHHTWIFCRASTCAHAIARSDIYRDLYGENYEPEQACPEGEYAYHHMYSSDQEGSSYKTMVGLGSGNPGWDHWQKYGRAEGRRYICFDRLPEPTGMTTSAIITK